MLIMRHPQMTMAEERYFIEKRVKKLPLSKYILYNNL